MKIFGKRKAACLDKQLMIASAVTLSCLGLIIICHAMQQTRGIMTDLNKQAFDTSTPQREQSGGETSVVCEEDAGDANEI